MTIDDRLDQLSRELLSVPYCDLNAVQRSVIDLIAAEAPTGVNPVLKTDDRSFGERLADKVAAVGGSWGFIIAFGLVLFAWMAVNTVLKPMGLAFDTYPFIFLNLMLSMLAAIQAPVILMSQNRQAEKDRAHAEHDYEVNLKAELEIMGLHEKLDRIRSEHLEELLRAQQEQLGLLTQLVGANGPRREAGADR